MCTFCATCGAGPPELGYPVHGRARLMTNPGRTLWFGTSEESVSDASVVAGAASSSRCSGCPFLHHGVYGAGVVPGHPRASGAAVQCSAPGDAGPGAAAAGDDRGLGAGPEGVVAPRAAARGAGREV